MLRESWELGIEMHERPAALGINLLCIGHHDAVQRPAGLKPAAPSTQPAAAGCGTQNQSDHYTESIYCIESLAAIARDPQNIYC